VAIQWLNAEGQEMRQEVWAQHQNFVLGYKLSSNIDQSALLVIFSNDVSDRWFTLPPTETSAQWRCVLDTNIANGESVEPDLDGGSVIKISAASVTVLASRTHKV
jgi:pullulanase/glycogen debranching enzyme